MDYSYPENTTKTLTEITIYCKGLQSEKFDLLLELQSILALVDEINIFRRKKCPKTDMFLESWQEYQR